MAIYSSVSKPIWRATTRLRLGFLRVALAPQDRSSAATRSPTNAHTQPLADAPDCPSMVVPLALWSLSAADRPRVRPFCQLGRRPSSTRPTMKARRIPRMTWPTRSFGDI